MATAKFDPIQGRGASAPQSIGETLRRGYEQRDAELLASVYADDVEFTVINRNTPPSKPLVLRSREAVRRVLEDVCSREMTHRVADLVIGDDRVAYSAHCQYPDGARVMALHIAQVRDGKICSEISVDCWDE